MEDWRERRYSAFLNMYPVICSWNMRLARASPVAMAVVSNACRGRDPKSPSTVVRTASCTCTIPHTNRMRTIVFVSMVQYARKRKGMDVKEGPRNDSIDRQGTTVLIVKKRHY